MMDPMYLIFLALDSLAPRTSPHLAPPHMWDQSFRESNVPVVVFNRHLVPEDQQYMFAMQDQLMVQFIALHALTTHEI